MNAQTILTFAFYAAGIATFIFVGKSNLKKQTIADQKEFIGIQADEVEFLNHKIEQLEKRIQFLEDLISGGIPGPRVVQEKPFPRTRGRGRRSGPADAGPEGDGPV